MQKAYSSPRASYACVFAVLLVTSCGGESAATDDAQPDGTGGEATGGAAVGGNDSGGADSSGGNHSGGNQNSGGGDSGGNASGGSNGSGGASGGSQAGGSGGLGTGGASNACDEDTTRVGTTACMVYTDVPGVLEEKCQSGEWTDTASCLDTRICLEEGAVQPTSELCGLNVSGTLDEICVSGKWVRKCFDTSECADGDAVALECSYGADHITRTCQQGIWQDNSTCVYNGIVRANVTSAGVQANAGAFSPRISADGRYVVFASDAGNLRADSATTRQDIYVHDFATGATTNVSKTPYGEPANGDSFEPSISPSGEHVAFSSVATNLSRLQPIFPGKNVFLPTSGWGLVPVANPDQFTAAVHESGRPSVDDSGTVAFQFDPDGASSIPAYGFPDLRWLLSVDAYGEPANAPCYEPSLGEQGIIAFSSPGTNFDPNDLDENGFLDIFLHDHFQGTTKRLNLGVHPELEREANQHSGGPSIAADGCYVAYWSLASNLVDFDTNDARDIFLYRCDSKTIRVSQSSDGPSGANGPSYEPSISPNHRYVAFASDATNLVPDDLNGVSDVFVFDTQTSDVRRVSVNAKGQEANSSSYSPSVSSNGRVTFVSYADNLVPGDTNNAPDVFVTSVE